MKRSTGSGNVAKRIKKNLPPWHDLLKRERAIDQKLLQRKVTIYPQMTYHSSLWNKEDALLMGENLIVRKVEGCSLFRYFTKVQRVNYIKALVRELTTKEDKPVISTRKQTVAEIKKISEKAFVSVGIKDLLFWKFLSHAEKKNCKYCKLQNQPLDKNLYFNDKELIYASLEKKDICSFYLDFFQLENPSQCIQLKIESKSDSQELLESTDKYLIIKDFKRKIISIHYRKKDDAIHTYGQFLTIFQDKALFYDWENRFVFEIDLLKEENQIVYLCELDACPAAYMTDREYYFVTDKQIHVYSVNKKERKSWKLIESGQVSRCEFIRVTQRLVMFSLEIEEKRKQFEEIVVYDLDEVRSKDKLTNLWDNSDNEGFFLFNDTFVLSCFFESEKGPCQMQLFEYGIPSPATILVNDISFLL